MNKTNNDRFAAIILLAVFIVFVVLLILAEGFPGGSDNITHYRYSLYALKEPKWLLYHWGKPVFTLLTSLPAQLGFIGVQVFNLITSVFSAWLVYLSAKRLNLRNSYLSIFFVCFTPVYAVMMTSGMTEILFSFFVIATVYLFLSGKYLWAAILISFSPLVRTEGIYIVPIVLFLLLYKRKYRIAPFVFTGFVLYSIIGYFYYHNIFWLITEMPYRGATDLYGTGSLAYYFKRAPHFLGIPVIIFLLSGLYFLTKRLFRNFKHELPIWLIIAGPFLAYFMGHVMMWWTGIGNSDGEVRYMAAIVPSAALICMVGLDNVLGKKWFESKQLRKYILVLVVAVTLVFTCFNSYQFPIPFTGTQREVSKCSDWLNETGLNERRLFYYDPDFIYYLNLDPYDESKSRSFVFKAKTPEYNLNKGDLVIWDGHHSFNNLPLENIIDNPYFKLIKEFKPQKNFKFWDHDYCIYIFEKVGYDKSRNNRAQLVKFQEVDKESDPIVAYHFNDPINHADSVFIEKTGNEGYIKTDTCRDFYLTHELNLFEKCSRDNFELVGSGNVKVDGSVERDDILWVVSKSKNDKILEYYTIDYVSFDPGTDGWVQLKLNLSLQLKSNKEKIHTYLWIRTDQKVKIDDFYLGTICPE